MLRATGRWLPAPWDGCPPARGVHGSPGAVVLLEHPWPWETLSLWLPSAGALPSVGKREQAWGGTGTAGLVEPLSPALASWRSRAQEPPQQQGLWQSPEQAQGCFVQIPWVVFSFDVHKSLCLVSSHGAGLGFPLAPASLAEGERARFSSSPWGWAQGGTRGPAARPR